MAGVITTGNHPRALWPGLKAIWGRTYDEHSQEWRDIFDVETSNKQYEEDVEVTGFGLAPAKTEGENVQYDSEIQGTVTRYTNISYALGYIVTKEEMMDNLYPEVSKRRSQALAFSMKQTKENVHANILNRGFNSSFVHGDGVELFTESHPVRSGVQSNIATTNTDLNETAVEDMLIQIMNVQNSRGLRISLMGDKLIVPPSLSFMAERIVKSNLQNDTANNAVNAIKSMGLLRNGVCVNHYLTDSDAWFIKTSAPRGLMHFNRYSPDMTQDNEFDTENAKAKCYERYSAGVSDFRGVFGSPGA